MEMVDGVCRIAVLAALLAVWYARATVLIAGEAREDAATAHAEQMVQQASSYWRVRRPRNRRCSPVPASYMEVGTADRKPALTLKRLRSP
jgi:hypothetical protein